MITATANLADSRFNLLPQVAVFCTELLKLAICLMVRAPAVAELGCTKNVRTNLTLPADVCTALVAGHRALGSDVARASPIARPVSSGRALPPALLAVPPPANRFSGLYLSCFCPSLLPGLKVAVSTAPPLFLPAALFTLQAGLNLYAATGLDAVTFQVTNQMKILPTAGFSSLFLHRRLSTRQVVSLPLLAVGVSLVHLSNKGVETGETGRHDQAWWLGLIAAVCAAVFSG